MIALYQYFGYKEVPIRERFGLIKAAGFDAVGLWRDDWLGWTGHREYADMARVAGLEVIDGHAPFVRDYDIINSLWLDNLDGETTYEIYHKAIKECGEDGVSNLIVHLADEFDGKRVVALNETGISRMKRLVETAEKYEVTIALENLDYHNDLEYVFERVDSPNLGFCYDIGHRNCHEPEVDLLSLYGNKLVALHLHDNDGSGDQHLLPFGGNIDWQEQMSKIAATGYNGPTTLESVTNSGPGEVLPGGAPAAEKWLCEAYAAAKRLDAMREMP